MYHNGGKIKRALVQDKRPKRQCTNSRQCNDQQGVTYPGAYSASDLPSIRSSGKTSTCARNTSEDYPFTHDHGPKHRDTHTLVPSHRNVVFAAQACCFPHFCNKLICKKRCGADCIRCQQSPFSPTEDCADNGRQQEDIPRSLNARSIESETRSSPLYIASVNIVGECPRYWYLLRLQMPVSRL